MRQNIKISHIACCAVLLALLILGTVKPVYAGRQVSVPLIPYRDAWDPAKPRFLDIGNRVYQSWVNPLTRQGDDTFHYNNRQVVLTYDQFPSGAQFVGRITARGLKPNFCYQIKLLGKPVHGKRGWGIYGNDTINENLGYAGRWWHDEGIPPTTNITDSYYRNHYLNKPPEARLTIYGYLYIGAFITNERGNYSGPVIGDGSYHVTWQSWQPPTIKGADAAFFRKAGTWQLPNAPGYGYGSTRTPITLYYEYEKGRPQPVNLPPGTYNCRLLLTEESFHSNARDAPGGGVWKSVLGNEDFIYDAAGNASPDKNPANDIVFTIRPHAPSGLSATAANGQVALTWTASVGATGYNIKRAATAGPLKYSTIARAATTTFVDKAVANGSSYLYTVAAVNAAGESTASAAVSAKPAPTNQPPAAFIDLPADNALYSAGETIRYTGRGIDPEDDDLPPDALSWRVDFHSGAHVYSSIAEQVGHRGRFIVPTIGETSPDVFYRIHLTVRDSGGLTHSTYRDIVPRKSVFTLATNPLGLQVTLDGQPRTTPLSVTGVAGLVRSLGVVPIQTVGGNTHVFEKWLDTATATRYVPLRSNNTTYTAVFRSCPVVVWRNRANVKVTGNALEKIAGGTGWNAGAASSNFLLSGDGYAAISISDTKFSGAFGLSSADVDQSLADIDFALVAQAGSLSVFEKGIRQDDAGSYVAGDLLKVAIEQGTVKYYRNNTLLYTNTKPALTYPMRLDTSFSEEGSSLENFALCGENLSAARKPSTTVTGTPR